MYIHLPVADMRQEPEDHSKMVSQALFAEKVNVLKCFHDWAYIQTPDQYLGWVKSEKLIDCKEYKTDLETTRVCSHIYLIKDVEYGPLMSLAFGSKLKLCKEIDERWNEIELPDGQKAFIQKGDVQKEPFDLATFGHKFLGVPYTWGGRSSFGFDCSGFIQMIYRKMGIDLARDAKIQILDPRLKKTKSLSLGDLIFWGKSITDILHVGMFLKEDLFIHTSSKENKPYVRMSSLNDFEWSANPKSDYPFRCFCTLYK